MSSWLFMIWAVLRASHLCVVVRWRPCVCVSKLLSLTLWGGRQRLLCQHHAVSGDPPLALAPALPTWNLNLSPVGWQVKAFLAACVWDTPPPGCILDIKAEPFAFGCTLFAAYGNRRPTEGSTSAAGLEKSSWICLWSLWLSEIFWFQPLQQNK